MDQVSGLAPVVVFAYQRPVHLGRVLDALATNEAAERSRVTVMIDGPRTTDQRSVSDRVEDEARKPRSFGELAVLRRDSNLGLADSILNGVSTVLENDDRIIVLEDDTVVGRHFLDYMNDALVMYEDDARVASIHGYVYPVGVDLPETFFMRGADCWGWATWSRAWRQFERDGRTLQRQLVESGEQEAWDFSGEAGLNAMLEATIAGEVDSWAVRWSASAHLRGQFTLYPGRSLVANIGNEGSGRHAGSTSSYDVDLCDERIPVERIPMQESAAGRKAFMDFYRSRNRLTLGERLRRAFRQDHR